MQEGKEMGNKYQSEIASAAGSGVAGLYRFIMMSWDLYFPGLCS
jgi:hypothetical protein